MSERKWLQLVLLRHDLPDGSHHFDWMFAVDEPPAERLRTYRVQRRPDEAAVGDRIEIERIGDHRTAYLSYEGPISGGRGSVRRVAAGRYRSLESNSSAKRLEIRWDGRSGRRAIWQWHDDSTAELLADQPASAEE